MATLSTALNIKVGVVSSALTADLSKVTNNVGKTLRNIEKKAITSLGKIAKYGTVALAGIAVGALKGAGDAEKAWLKITTLFKEGQDELKGYRDLMTEVAYESGRSMPEIGEAVYQAVSAGFRDLAAATNIVKAATKAAVAGDVELATSVDAITRVLNAYNLEGDKAAHVSDLLFQTVNYGVTQFSELAPVIGMVAGSAGKAGVKIEELMSTLAVMTKYMPTTEAATSLNAIIMGFLKPTEQAKEAAHQYGIELSQVTLATKGLAWAIQKVSELSAEQSAELFPNIRALRGVFAAGSQAGKELTDTLEKFNDVQGVTEQASGKMESGFSHMIGVVWNAVKVTLSNIADVFLPEIETALAWIINTALPSVEKWVAEFKKSAEDAVAGTPEADWQTRIVLKWKTLLAALKADVLPVAKEVGEAIGKAIVDGVIAATKSLGKSIMDWAYELGEDIGAWLYKAMHGGNPDNLFNKNGGSYQFGGPIEGDTAQPIPIMAHGGEFVMNAEATKQNRALLEALNAQGNRGYSDASTNIFNFGSEFSRRLVREQLIPELAYAKKSGFGIIGAW